MADLKLTTAGDLEFANLGFSLVTELDAIRQSLSIRLQFFKGEWFLNINSGIPYYESILVKNPDGALVRAILKEAILTTEGVVALLSFSDELSNSLRQSSIEFTVSTIYGDLDMTEIL